MNFLQLCQTLRRKVGASGTGPAAVTGQSGEYARLVNWIIESAEEIESLWQDWHYLHASASITTVSGTAAYSLATMSLTSLAAWDRESFFWKPSSDDHRHLDVLDYKEWRRTSRLGASVASGVPDKVVIKPDKSLVFYPTPNAAGPVTADYWSVPTRLAANTDTPAIPAQFHMIIVERAKMMYAEFEDAPEVFAAANSAYGSWLQRLEAAELPGQQHRRRAQTDEELVVRPV